MPLDETTATAEPTPAQKEIPTGTHLRDMVDGWKDTAREDDSASQSTPRGDTRAIDSGDRFDASLLRQAKDLGLSEQEAKDFGTPERLQRALASLDREMMSIRRSREAPRDDRSQSRQQPQQRQDDRQPPARDEQPRDGQGRFVSREKLELDEWDEDLVDGTVVKNFSAMKDHYEKRIARLEEALEVAMPALSETYEDARAAKIASFDAALAKLGPAFKDVFGEEETADLDPQSELYRNRDRVFTTALELRDELRSRRKKVPRWDELVRRAAHLEFDGRTQKQAREELRSDLDRRQEESTYPPSHRQGRDARTRGDSEEEHVAAFWKKRGFDYKPVRTEDPDWLPPERR